MKKLMLIILLTLSGAATADQYLCIGEKATGFSYDKTAGDWIPTIFEVDNEKFIVKPSKEEGYKYDVVRHGTDFPVSRCKEGFIEGGGFLKCDKWVVPEMPGFTSGDPFKMSNRSLRFIYSQDEGYVLPPHEERVVQPHMVIGRCSPL